MICPSCSASRAPNDKFCGNCGIKPSPLSCPSCECQISIGDKFCGNCGTALGHQSVQSQQTPHLTNKQRATELNNDGLNAYHAGDYDRAIQLLSQAIQLNPGLAVAYSNRGLSYSKKGELKQALNDFDKAIYLNPDSELAYFNRGTLYSRLGKKKQARRDFKTVQSFAGELGNRAKEGLSNLGGKNAFGLPFVLLCVFGGAALSDFVINIEVVQSLGFASYLDGLLDRLGNFILSVRHRF